MAEAPAEAASASPGPGEQTKEVTMLFWLGLLLVVAAYNWRYVLAILGFIIASEMDRDRHR